MNDTPFRLSLWQMALLVFIVGLGVTPLSVGMPLLRALGRNAWMAALPALAGGLWGVGTAAALARRFPRRPLDRVAVSALGPLAGRVYILLLALLCLTGAAVNLHPYVRAASSVELTHLPLAYPAVLVAAAGAYAAYFGPEVVARCAEVCIFLLVPALLAIFAGPVISVHSRWLLPVGGMPLSRFLVWPVAAMSGSVRGFLPLLLLGPFCRPLPRPRPLLWIAAAVAVLFAVSLALPITVLGQPLALSARYPLLAVTGTVGWELLPTNRIVIIATVTWMTVAVIVFATYLCLGAWLLGRLMPGLPRRVWSWAVPALAALAAAAAGASLPEGLVRSGYVVWNLSLVALCVAVPTGLLAFAPRRGSRPSGGRSGRPASVGPGGGAGGQAVTGEG